MNPLALTVLFLFCAVDAYWVAPMWGHGQNKGIYRGMQQVIHELPENERLDGSVTEEGPQFPAWAAQSAHKSRLQGNWHLKD